MRPHTDIVTPIPHQTAASAVPGAGPRRATARALAGLCGVAITATVLAGCSGDASENGDGDAPEGTPAAGQSTPSQNDSDAADADGASAADGSAGEDAPAEGGEPFATATWDGTSYEYSSVSCRDEAVLGQFQMLATGSDAPTLTVLIEYPGGETDPDLSQPSRIELFFAEGGGTVGESEGYEARDEAITGVTASAAGASGSLALGPDEDTAAAQTNPDGGQLDFELACG